MCLDKETRRAEYILMQRRKKYWGILKLIQQCSMQGPIRILCGLCMWRIIWKVMPEKVDYNLKIKVQ